MKEIVKTKAYRAFLPWHAMAALSGLLLVITAAAVAADTRSFQRMGLTIEVPSAFGDPVLDRDEESHWSDEAMQEDAQGIDIILTLTATREEVLDELQAGGEISDRHVLHMGPREFERFAFDLAAEGLSGLFYLSKDAYEGGRHVFLVIGAPSDNLDAAQDDIDAIAGRIERANRIE